MAFQIFFDVEANYANQEEWKPAYREEWTLLHWAAYDGDVGEVKVRSSLTDRR